MVAPNQLNKLRDANQPLSSRQADGVGATLNPIAVALGSTPIMGASPPPWVTPGLAADFLNVAGRQKAAYHRDALGYTWLKFALSTAAGAAANATLMTLDMGYRPLGGESVVLPGTNGVTLAYSPISVSAVGVVTSLVALAAGDSIIVYAAFLAAF